jgi:hypothetical protein
MRKNRKMNFVGDQKQKVSANVGVSYVSRFMRKRFGNVIQIEEKETLPAMQCAAEGTCNLFGITCALILV